MSATPALIPKSLYDFYFTQSGYHDIAAEQKLLKEFVDRNIVINLTEE